MVIHPLTPASLAPGALSRRSKWRLRHDSLKHDWTPDAGGSVPDSIGVDDVDIDTVAASLAEHARLTAVLRDKIAELGDSDHDRWVGLGCDEFPVIGRSLPEVMAKLEQRGVSDGTVVVEFLSAEPVEMIL